MVYYFSTKDQADHFEQLLVQKGYSYERGLSKDLIKRHLFGVHISIHEEVKHLNNEVCNAYRKPFLGSDMLKNGVLILTLAIVLLALIGYFLAQRGNS